MAADAPALSLGITPGLTLADARARVPDLAVAEMDDAADAALLERLADACDRYTPLVALDAPHGLILDITGCAHLFGGEAALRDDLLRRCADVKMAARASIAGTPEAARALARFGGCAIAAPDGEADAVKSLRAAALGLAPDIILALSRAGLKTIGDLAIRPRAPLAARFGEALLAQLARTLGQEDIGITPRRPLPACIVERRFAEPLTREEDALGALASLATQAGRILEERGEGGRQFESSFFRTDGKVIRLSVTTSRPARDPDILMRLFRERIDALADPLDPGFGFDLIRLSVIASEAFAAVQTSLDRRTFEDEEVAALVDRLGARFGAGSVQFFTPSDTHIPERAACAVPASSRIGNAAWPKTEPGEPPARPLHLFDPPQAIEALAGVPDGPPLRFRWRRVLHEIARAEGPERIAAEWWRESEVPTRDYYRVEDAQGRRFWLFRDGLYGEEPNTPKWFLHGIFP